MFERLWIQSSEDAQKAGIEPDQDGNYQWEPGKGPCRWRPSIHMPRWASRISLEVVNTRVERIQDISEADAKAEGVEENICQPPYTCPQYKGDGKCCNADSDEYINYLADEDGEPCYSARDSFRTFWDSINISRGYGWDANPWAWVAEFRVAAVKA